jgi:signal transduction histidine kinase
MMPLPVDDRLLPRLRLTRNSAAALIAASLLGLALMGRLDVGGSQFFHPHGYCYLWRTDLVTGHVVSDLIIGLSYVAISLTLWNLVRRAHGAIPFSWMFIAFGTFIVACGGTHFMEILTLWTPLFWTSMDVKLVTAAASVTTAIALPPLIPKVLALIDQARVSEDRRMELERAQNELAQRVEREKFLRIEAQTASRKKDEFLTNMSHELRTPLNSVIGFTELMFDGKVGAVSTHHKEYLGDVLTSARHLLHLINDVLDLSKVGSGKMEFFPEPMDVSSAISELRHLVRGLADTKQISIEVLVDPRLTGVVTDPARLKQILYNYVANALKFTPEGGHVSIRASLENDREFRLEVEDNGLGIHPEDLERLFVEFEQLDSSAGKRFHGTGLGLALTKRLVEAQDGSVGVRSTLGRGSVFHAVLPRVAKAAGVPNVR